ncbi:MAG: transposase family protein, partial [Desulfobacteraceae bacterium]|nr:transposase family protein [Desulfobacteraceae bacterium]
KFPAKNAVIKPWKSVCVDLVGPYTLKGKDGTILDFMCLTMIDPATAWFEIVELPNAAITVVQKGEELTKIIIDKSSAEISRLFNKQWLSCYPRAKNIVYDNGSKFKLHFQQLCEEFRLKPKPTTVRNPRANAILERMHGVLGDMLCTYGLDMSKTVTTSDINDFIVNAAWAICSTYHTVLKPSPGAAIFGRDMMFDLPYLADWTATGQQQKLLVDKSNVHENNCQIDFDYQVGQKCLLEQDSGKLC